MSVGFPETLAGGEDQQHLFNIQKAADHWAQFSGNARTLDFPVAKTADTLDPTGSINSVPSNPAAAMAAQQTVEDERIGNAAKLGFLQRVAQLFHGFSKAPRQGTA